MGYIIRYHATTVALYQATLVETMRAAVKLFGKEAATHRFTAEEKKALADLVYTTKAKGYARVKTRSHGLASTSSWPIMRRTGRTVSCTRSSAR